MAKTEWIGSVCEILPMNKLEGRVMAIVISNKGIEYQVSYKMKGAGKVDYFLEKEVKLK